MLFEKTYKKSIQMNNIDVLRSMAILSVFCHHISHVYNISIPFLDKHGGWVGVQLFFLISGYLIIQSAQKYRLKEYFTYRFFRIFPVYWIISYLFFYLKGSFPMRPADILINGALIQHFFPLAMVRCDVLHVTWTLTVELTWYLIAPLLVIFFSRYKYRILVISLLISTLWTKLSMLKLLDFLYIKQFHLLDSNNIEAYRYLFLNNSFGGQFCFFVIGAFIYFNEEQLKKNNILILYAITSFFVFWWPHMVNCLTNPNFLSGIGLGALFVIALKADVLKSRPIKFISDISYSIYLTHFVVLLYVREQIESPFWGTILSLLAILILSAFTYFLIEQPMIKYSRKLFIRDVPILIKP